MSTRITLLIDGDILVYRAAAASQVSVEFSPGQLSIQADLEQAKQRVDADVADLQRVLDADDILICLSDTQHNWRKELEPSYKAQRTVKPAAFAATREYVQKTHKTVECARLEADDVMGLYSTGKTIAGTRIIVSRDKDLRTIPGFLYNDGHPEYGVKSISLEEANHNHLMQTLTGDRVDGYAGLLGCGPKKAFKILYGLEAKDRWPALVAAYEKGGLTEDDALKQARLARILRAGEYTKTTGKVKLWKPA